ncbi:MAG: sulfotransferase, partial [Desulfobacterales bacterium]|nr:sulfotransferase [Desulfobacterales bacterium]
LRHPVDRAYSNFLHGKRDDREPERDFLAAYRASGGGARDNWPRALRYQRFGAYAAGLKDWRARFHPDQLSIHLYEDLVDDPRALMKTLYRFLQVDDAFIPDISVRHNRGHLRRNMALFNLIRSRHPVKTLLRSLLPRTVRRGLSKGVNACNRKEAPRLDPGIRRALTRELRDEILDLQDLIQRDLSHWLETG